MSTEVDAELEVLKSRKQEEVQRENNENRFLVDNVNKRIPQFRLKYKKMAPKKKNIVLFNKFFFMIFQFFSSAVELIFNEHVGRHGRATR